MGSAESFLSSITSIILFDNHAGLLKYVFMRDGHKPKNPGSLWVLEWARTETNPTKSKLPHTNSKSLDPPFFWSWLVAAERKRGWP